MAEADEIDHAAGRKMFDDLRSEDAAERVIGKRVEVGKGVGLDHVTALAERPLDHGGADVQAACHDATFPQQFEKFPASAADVEDVVPTYEGLHIAALALGQVSLASAKAVFKQPVVDRKLRRRNRMGRLVLGSCLLLELRLDLIQPLAEGQHLFLHRAKLAERVAMERGEPVLDMRHHAGVGGVVTHLRLQSGRKKPLHDPLGDANDRRGDCRVASEVDVAGVVT